MNFREKLVEEFKKIIKYPEFKEVFFLLSKGDYNIELIYEIDTSLKEQGLEERISFGYIYNELFFEYRDDFYIERKSIKRKLNLNSTQISQDISEISRKLDTLYSFSLFDVIPQIMNEYMDYLSKQFEVNTNEENVSVYTNITLKVKGIRVLGIDYEEHDSVFDGGITDINKIKELLNIDTNLPLISEQNWFDNLNKDSQYLIKAGNQYLQNMYFAKNRDDILDYSPILFDYIKCIELEFVKHYGLFRNEIIKNAKKILDSETKILKKMIKISKDIVRYDNYKPNGINTLYYILKYLALGHNLDSIYNYKT